VNNKYLQYVDCFAIFLKREVLFMKIHVLILAIITSMSISMSNVEAVSQKDQRIQLEKSMKQINTAFEQAASEKDEKQRIEILKDIIQPNHLPRFIRTTLKSLYGNDTSKKKIFSYDAAEKTSQDFTNTFEQFIKNPDINHSIELVEKLTITLTDLSEKNSKIKGIKYTISDKYYTRHATELLFNYGINIFESIITFHDLKRMLSNQMNTINIAQFAVQKVADEVRKNLNLTQYSSKIF